MPKYTSDGYMLSLYQYVKSPCSLVRTRAKLEKSNLNYKVVLLHSKRILWRRIERTRVDILTGGQVYYT